MTEFNPLPMAGDTGGGRMVNDYESQKINEGKDE